MSSKRKIAKNLISSFAGKLISMAFAIVLPRLYIVGYGSEVNGLLSSVDQLLIYLSLFEAGVATASLQALYGPVARGDWESINGVLSATNRYYRRTGLIYGGGLLLIAVFYPLLVETGLSYGTVFGVIIFSGLASVVLFLMQGKYTALLQAEGKNYVMTNLSTVISVLTSISKIILIRLGVNIVLILAAGFAIYMIQATFIYAYVRHNYRQLDLSAKPNRKAIGQKNYVLLHQVSTLIFNNTDVLILTAFCDLRLVSVYTVFRMITSQLETILGYVTGSVNFVLGQNFKTEPRLYRARIDVLESFYGALSYGVFSVALFLMIPFMRLYTAGVSDVNYLDEKLAVLFVAVSVLNQTRGPMLMVINHAGHFQKTAGRAMLEAGINLTVSLVAVNIWGVYGVLLGTVVALLYRANDIIIYSNTRILQRKPWRSYRVYGVNLLLFAAMSVLYPRLFRGSIASYGRFFLVGLAATAVSLAVFIAAQLLVFPECRKALGGLFQKWTQRQKRK